MEPFIRYPRQGRELLGRPRDTTGACRSGYGLGLQRLTGQTTCAYCGLSLVDTYNHWLLLSVDHVVPRGEAMRLGVVATLYEDAINLVLCCTGCNGFGNRYRCDALPRDSWTLADFLALRDHVFVDRLQRIASRRNQEEALFASRPWETSRPTSHMRRQPSSKSVESPVDFSLTEPGPCR
jgi:hypothetical protein